MERTTPRLVLATVAVAAAAGLAACGGGDSSTTTSTADANGNFAQPQPTTHVADELDDFNKAIADQSCDEFQPFVLAQLRGTSPGAAPSDKECQQAQGGLAGLKGLTFTDSAEYGTAAVVAGKSDQGYLSLIFVLDRDGVYRLAYSINGDKQIGVSPVSTDTADKHAQQFVDAMKAKDCKGQVVYLFDTNGPLVASGGGSIDATCQSLFDGKIFVPALERTDQPTVTRMGETLDFAFYGVPTKDGWFTLIMDSGGGSGDQQQPPDQVYDVLASSDVPGLSG